MTVKNRGNGNRKGPRRSNLRNRRFYASTARDTEALNISVSRVSLFIPKPDSRLPPAVWANGLDEPSYVSNAGRSLFKTSLPFQTVRLCRLKDHY